MTDRSGRARADDNSDATAAAWTFFRQWLKNPRAVAALSPSSRQLARLMVGELPADARRVIELGGGTGVVTQALLERGIAPGNLLVVELNGELARFLGERFPKTSIVNGDAADLARIVDQQGYVPGSIDAVISGLGFLNMPRDLQTSILRAVFSILGPDRPLIQFTYSPISPLPRDLLDTLGLSARRAGMAWFNMPPATVYVYTRHRSRPVRAQRVI